ncbi:MAG: metallophosphoesterase family protein [Candidatus Njordarchaeales archaeon]
MGSDSVRIVHTADFHLGVSFRNITGYNVSEVRREDFKKNIARIFSEAINRDADMILISGDVFHRSDPSNRDFVFIANQVGRAAENGIYVIIIAGNHDKPKTTYAQSPLQGLVEAHAPYFYYFQSIPNGPLIININKESKRAKVAVVPIPYVDPRIVNEISEGSISYGKFINEEISRLIDSIPPDVDYKILMAHVTVKGAELKNIWSVYINEPTVARSDLIEHFFDYIALGHIHTPQEISKKVVYAGSIERIDFSELGEEKSFVLAELSEDGVSINRAPLECRPMLSTDTIKIKNALMPDKALSDILESLAIPSGSILRIILEADEITWKKLMKGKEILEDFLFNKKKILGYYLKHINPHSPMPENIDTELRRISLREKIIEYIKNLDIDNRVKERALELVKDILEEARVP